jgi:anthranilate phosphoribosyltransferase
VAETAGGEVRTFEIRPEDFGLPLGGLDALRGCDAEGNASIIREVLSGKRRDEARTLVVINAASALHVGGAASGLQDGVRLAEESIDEGHALEKLNALVRLTNG